MSDTAQPDDDGVCPGCGGSNGDCDCFDDDAGGFEFDCAMDRHGNCGKAGSEECDWECPFRNVKRN